MTSIPKFPRKQYFDSALRTEPPPTPHPSEYDVTNNDSDSGEEEEEEAADAAHDDEVWFEAYRPFLRMLKPDAPSNERWLRENVAPLNDRIKPNPGDRDHSREFKAAMFAEYQTPRWNGKNKLSQKQRAQDEERRTRLKAVPDDPPLEDWQREWIDGGS